PAHPAQHSFPTRRSSDLTRRALDALEGKLEDQFRLDGPHRAELLKRVVAHERIDLTNLGVGQPGIRLRKRDEVAVIPHAKRVIGDRKSTRLNSSHLVISY